MEKLGIYIEIDNGNIKETNFGLISWGNKANMEVHCFILDGNAAKYKDTLAKYGAAKVVNIDTGLPSKDYHPIHFASAISETAKALSIKNILGINSAQGKDLLARIGAKLDAAMILDSVGIDNSFATAKKSYCSGKAISDMKLQGDFKVIGLRPNIFKAEEINATADIIDHKLNLQDNGKFVIKSVTPAKSKGIELTEASIIISGGQGMGSGENFKIIFDAAAALGAAVGASRSAVDSGFIPYEFQVGQTGKTVGPNLYIACGISGAIQHFAGMKTSKVIVAINNDPEAPIFKKCDYGVLADLFQAVPMITKHYKKD